MDPVGCRGVHVPGHAACLTHIDPVDRDSYFSGLQPGDAVDHRGTTFNATLLTELLSALTDSESGRPILGKSWFEEANFTSEVSFNGTRFTGEAIFSAATFNDYVAFWDATFDNIADFSHASIDGIRFGRSADLKGGQVDLVVPALDAAGARPVGLLSGALVAQLGEVVPGERGKPPGRQLP